MSNRKKYNEKATLLNRMGFQEKDLRNTKHDDLCIWLSKDEIQKKIVQKYIIKDKRKNNSIIYDEIERIDEVIIRKRISTKIQREYNLYGYKSWLEYLEKLEEIKRKLIEGTKWNLKGIIHNSGDWEYIVKTDKGFYIGFIDFHRYCETELYKPIKDKTQKLFFNLNYEIKVSPQPIGEILRQLNMYYENLQGLCFVVCENNSWLLKYKEIIEDNGWIVFTPNDIEGI